MDYSFQVIGDDIVFDEDLDADKFLELHDIEEDTLFSISSVDGVLHLSMVFDEEEPDPGDELDYYTSPSDNILMFKRYAS